MVNKILNVFFIILGICIYFFMLKYGTDKWGIISLLHSIIEPNKKGYIGLRYLGEVYIFWSLIFNIILIFIYYSFGTKKNIYTFYFLFFIYSLLALLGYMLI